MAVPRRRLALVRAALLAGTVALAGCSGGNSSGAAGGASVVSSAQPPAGEGARQGGADQSSGAAGGATPASKAAPLPAAAIAPRVVRTAQVVVQVDGELAPAAARVRAVAQSLGGTVSSETTTYADGGRDTPAATPSSPGTGTGGQSSTAAVSAPSAAARPGESVLVLRVPEADLDRALTLISGAGGVGKELSRSATAQDVTADLADLASRVATQRASVTRVRALLAKATSLQDVVTLEAEVTKRESDLEAAEARRAALADRADLATLTVDLRTHEAIAVVHEEQPNAFLDGLRSGWKAVTASTAVILTVLGALLPVAVVVAVLGAPVLLWTRRRRSAARPAPPAPPASPAPAPDAGT